MGAHGSVTRLIIDLRSDEAAVRELAARLVWGRISRSCWRWPAAIFRPGFAAARMRKTSSRACTRASAFASRGDFDLSNRDQLWKLLVQITLRKARNTANRHLLAKRDVRREEPGAVAGGSGQALPSTILDQIDTDGPTPAEAALLNEALELRFQSLKDPNLRQIALCKLEGYTNQEIGARSSTSSTVERKLERIQAYWAVTED